MVKFVRALRRHPTLWVGPRFPYIWEIPCSSLQGSSNYNRNGLPAKTGVCDRPRKDTARCRPPSILNPNHFIMKIAAQGSFFLTCPEEACIRRGNIQVLNGSLIGNAVKKRDGPAAVTPPFSYSTSRKREPFRPRAPLSSAQRSAEYGWEGRRKGGGVRRPAWIGSDLRGQRVASGSCG